MDRGRHSEIIVGALLGGTLLALAACGPTPELAARPATEPTAPPSATTASPAPHLTLPGRAVGSGTVRGHDSATMLVLGQGAPPELLQLVRVLPIGQSVVHDGLELTALSLETYADGFLVNTRLLPAPAPPLTPESAVYPEFRLHATDERGGRYEGRPSGANGEGRQWRFTHVFMPALDAAVRELRLEVSEVRWQPFGRDKQPEVVQTGPWRFVVALPGDGHGVP